MNQSVKDIINTIRSELDPEIMSDDKKKEEQMDKEAKAQAHQAVEMVLSSDAVLFKDQFNKPYVAPDGHGATVIPVRSNEYRKRLCYDVFNHFEKPFSDNAIRSAISILEAKAVYEGEQYPLHVRVMNCGSEVWYDLGNGGVVVIGASGWRIIEEPPIIFKSFSHQAVQCSPVKGGEVTDIFKFFNIEGVGENGELSGTALLAMVWIVASFIPGFPHPILVLHGSNGSGKSTLFRYLKRLIDPSALEGVYLSRDANELIQQASHHWFLPYDNVSDLKQAQSDMLCRFCTGEGASKRQLYSDDDDVVYSFQVVMGLNGINLMVEKGDLLDRCILLPMKRIEEFREEAKMNAEFEKLKPQILGSIFDLVSLALQKIESVDISTQIRLADFARWGCAISEAMGYSREDFLSAYRENVVIQNQETLEASPVAKAIMIFMEDREEWSGTPTQLHSELETIAEQQKINMKDSLWPKDARWLSKRMMQVLPSLQAIGIHFEKSKGNKRTISLWKTEKNDDGDVGDVEGADNGKYSQNDGNDNTDVTDDKDSSPTISEIDDLFGKSSSS